MRIFSFEIRQHNAFISRLYFELWFLFSFAIGVLLSFLNGGLERKLAFSLLSGERSAAMMYMSVLLPLVITFISVFLRSRGLLLFVVFCKASLFAYAAILIFSSFPVAGWLIAVLILAGDWLCLIALHWLWSRCVAYRLELRKVDFTIVSFVILVVLLCEHFWFYPFAESVFIK